MAKLDISDKHFCFRCCWTCQHCVLDICQGYLCTAFIHFTIQLVMEGENANEIIHKDRSGCRAYTRG